MKRTLLIMFLAMAAVIAQGQTLTITDPAGMQEPYLVETGTEVTFTWEYGGTAPSAFYSYPEQPVFPDFGPDEAWTVHNNFTDNGDGTYSLTLQVDEPVFVWGGAYSSWLMMWSFSNVIEVGIASGVEISATDLFLCPGSGDSQLLTVNGSYTSYQWYVNDAPVSGATSSSYSATEAGAYKVQVPLDGELVFSNTLYLSYPVIDIEGSFNGVQLTMSATEGFSAYQWLSGPSETNLTPISGAVSQSYSLAPAAMAYFAVNGVVDGCTVTSQARMVSAESFAEPQITISADTNSFNKVCEGTEIHLSTSPVYGSYNWLQNTNEAGYYDNAFVISNSYQAGLYEVVVSPVGWPEISIYSDQVNISYFAPFEPVISGVENYGSYCPGQTISVILGDEGYQYNWYVHEAYEYTEADLVEVAGSTYSFVFEVPVRVTIVGTYQGCSSATTVMLNSYASESIYAGVQNYYQQYLCTDSSAVLEVTNWNINEFENFQWKKYNGNSFADIPGADQTTYTTSTTGQYVVEATVSACPEIQVVSEPLMVYDYTERELFIYANDEKLCLDDTTYLNIAGGYEWTAIQWFEEDIQMGASGYEKVYLPMVNGGNTEQQEVHTFNSYLAKAKHVSCPNGLKTTSNKVMLKPLVNPVVTPEPNPGVASWNLAAFDSIPFYTFCQGATVILSTAGEYSAYEYFESGYAGDDDFELGTSISLENPVEIMATGANYYTLLVDSAGCVGMSTPLLIDTYVFQSPAITSYNNSELCEPGDSTLLHIAFPGDWSYFEWFLNGSLLSNSNNDSIYASIAGEYTVTAYPTICPDVGFSSGVGPVVTFLNATIEEDEDLIYAMPELGFYEYQWYFNGEPIPGSNIPWILYKEDMPAGVYTVEVSNPGGCVSLSDPFNWNPTGISTRSKQNLSVAPNPVKDVVNISGVETGMLKSYSILDAQGREVLNGNFAGTSRIDAASLPSGNYLLQISISDGSLSHLKIVLE